MKFSISILFSECLWGDPDDFSKFIDGIVFQWYHLNTILSINCLLSKIIYIILQLHFNCQQPLSRIRPANSFIKLKSKKGPDVFWSFRFFLLQIRGNVICHISEIDITRGVFDIHRHIDAAIRSLRHVRECLTDRVLTEIASLIG